MSRNFTWPANVSSQGPVQFILNGSTVQVTEDTGTPANSKPLPVTILDSSGNVLDTNYGAVGAHTLRTAAEVGNATGAANFGAGVTGAQTLRVEANQGVSATAANGWTVKPTDGTNSQAYLATGEAKVSVTQPIAAGTNIIGKVGIDQTTPGTTNGVQVNAALPAGSNVIGHVITDTGSTTAVTGNVTVVQPTAANLNATVTGTVTVTSTTANQGTANTVANAWPVKNTDGTNTAAVKAASTASVATDPALVVSISPNNTPVLPSGAATSALQTSGNTSLTTIATNTPTVGQKTMSASSPVVIASDQSAIPTTIGGSAGVSNAPVLNQYGTTNITTTAYVQLIASTTAATTYLDIFDSSGQTMILATGGAGSEVVLFQVPPGGDQIRVAIPSGTRIAYKALTGNAVSGYLSMNLLK